MPILRNAVAALAVLIMSSACADANNDGENAREDVTVTQQSLSYGNNDCWYAGTYNEHWVDPNNSGSGEHVVIWYHCAENFATPLSTYATIEVENVNSGWMIWQAENQTYMVFANGYYWWYMRAWYSPSQIIAGIHLY